MTYVRRRFAGTLGLVLLAVALAGCADPAAAPGAGGRDRAGKGFCPPPEAPQAEPSPCITFDWNQRVAENHAFRSPLPITEEQRRQAAPKAEALAAALTELAASGTSQDALRAAAARALSLTPDQIELRGARFDPLRDVLVGGGEGRVCVNGSVDGTGKADAEVVGRTADGTCLPGLGGH
ncbi:precorrin-3B C(17)-methyltransferase [Actinacidiphila glaucinigra]|uniref:precorrin-3B C(17)-methyltransferase n=1 Tax=Actinacidiphila glaucinigra TaxID=235986 RepID=UPI0036DFEF62